MSGTVALRVPFRKLRDANKRRALAVITLAEIVDFVLTHKAALEEDDPPLVYARLMQIERLTASSRERLNEAIARAQTLQATSDQS